jgi:hypothetical protein
MIIKSMKQLYETKNALRVRTMGLFVYSFGSNFDNLEDPQWVKQNHSTKPRFLINVNVSTTF